jgi:hypothetical protein
MIIPVLATSLAIETVVLAAVARRNPADRGKAVPEQEQEEEPQSRDRAASVNAAA